MIATSSLSENLLLQLLNLDTLSSFTPHIPSTVRQHTNRLTAVFRRFRNHHARLYGDSRIDILITALSKPTRHCALKNYYSITALTTPPDSYLFPPTLSSCPPLYPGPVAGSYTTEGVTFLNPAAARNRAVRSTHYLLDAASLLPVVALDVRPGQCVLDLCAAPGGKSVAIAQHLRPFSGSATQSLLCANEIDGSRRKRLANVVQGYLATLDGNGIGVAHDGGLEVRVTGHDGMSGISCPSQDGGWDRILVDAPCSSERHVLQAAVGAMKSGNEKGLGDLLEWTPAREKRCASVQKKLLAAALGSVKVGGRVVYATCSLAAEENDEVVKSVCGKGGEWRDRAKVVRPKGEDAWVGERTGCGWIVLPDVADGWGPLYFSAMMRYA
jgi:16S rRNA C967 or C1407 C5-methylase (RsmB/RsmF family)